MRSNKQNSQNSIKGIAQPSAAAPQSQAKRPPPAGSSSSSQSYVRGPGSMSVQASRGGSTGFHNRSPSPGIKANNQRATKSKNAPQDVGNAQNQQKGNAARQQGAPAAGQPQQQQQQQQQQYQNQAVISAAKETLKMAENQQRSEDYQGLASRLQPEDYPFEQVNNLIHEYLLKNNLMKTLDTFQEELTQPLPPYDQSRGYEYQLMEHFKKGQRDEFFIKWNRFLPLSVLVGDDKVTKLEFYLQIFFLIFPIHPFFKRQQEIDQDSANFFKDYLDTRGAALSKTNEFLHYYALPYIPRPHEHQALKHLFTNQWIEGVRYQLNEFLASMYDNQPLPLLFYVYQNYVNANSSRFSQNENNDSMESSSKKQTNNKGQIKADNSSNSQDPGEVNVQALMNENRDLINVVKQFNEKYTMLSNHSRMVQEQNKQIIIESHQKWMAIANELILISKNMKQMIDGNAKNGGVGYSQDTLNMLQNRIDKYESFLSMNIEDLISHSQDISLFDKQSFINDGEHHHGNNPVDYRGGGNNFLGGQNYQFQIIPQDPMKYDNPYCALDFLKIKQIITKQEDPTLCCAILQALRWRVSKARGAYVRREIVVTYATFDIIGCETPEDQVLQEALFQKDLRIQEFALRLINAMASDFYGRTYLIKSSNLAILLIQILRIEKEDSFTRRNALGALQKLSLRRKPQIVMIKNDLISWIVKTLREEKDTLSEYSYEYATALFMNLSLRSSGKLKCEDPNEGVLNVLNDLLEHENMQVRTFVNGTLYSLLGRQSLREQARAMGMNEILSYLMESSDERFTKQIQYIMDQLNKEKPDEDALSDSNEEDNDVDDIDDEEEIGEDEQADDIIEDAGNIPFGEDLLYNKFRLEGPEAIKQQNITKRIIQESHQQRMISSANTNANHSFINQTRGGVLDIPFNRPATPSMSASYISHSQKTSQNYRSQASQQQQRGQNKSRQDVQRGSTPLSYESGSKNFIHSQFDPNTAHDLSVGDNNAAQEEFIRNLPSEMRSRPKILRTPVGGERQRIEQLQKQHEDMIHSSYVQQANIIPPVKKEKPNQPSTKPPLDRPSPPKESKQQVQSPQQQQQKQPLQQQPQQQQQQQQQPPPKSPPEIDESVKSPLAQNQAQQQQGPTEIAFESKPKIPRTPPGLLK